MNTWFHVICGRQSAQKGQREDLEVDITGQKKGFVAIDIASILRIAYSISVSIILVPYLPSYVSATKWNPSKLKSILKAENCIYRYISDMDPRTVQ